MKKVLRRRRRNRTKTRTTRMLSRTERRPTSQQQQKRLSRRSSRRFPLRRPVLRLRSRSRQVPEALAPLQEDPRPDSGLVQLHLPSRLPPVPVSVSVWPQRRRLRLRPPVSPSLPGRLLKPPPQVTPKSNHSLPFRLRPLPSPPSSRPRRKRNRLSRLRPSRRLRRLPRLRPRRSRSRLPVRPRPKSPRTRRRACLALRAVLRRRSCGRAAMAVC